MPRNAKSSGLEPLTVLVATHDRPQAVEVLLGCLAAEAQWISKLVIVDDGSSSRHATALQQLLERVSWTEVTHVRFDERVGSAVARNSGISLVETQRFLLVDDDCLTSRNLLRNSLKVWDSIKQSDARIVGLALPCLHRSTEARRVDRSDIGYVDWENGAVRGNFDVMMAGAGEYLPIDYLNGVALIDTASAKACGGFIELYPEWPAAVSDFLFFSAALTRTGGRLYFANVADRSFAVHLKFGAPDSSPARLQADWFALNPSQVDKIMVAAQRIGQRSGHRVDQTRMSEEIMGGVASFFLAKSTQAAISCMSRLWDEYVVEGVQIGRYAAAAPSDQEQRLKTWLIAMMRAQAWAEGLVSDVQEGVALEREARVKVSGRVSPLDYNPAPEPERTVVSRTTRWTTG